MREIFGELRRLFVYSVDDQSWPRVGILTSIGRGGDPSRTKLRKKVPPNMVKFFEIWLFSVEFRQQCPQNNVCVCIYRKKRCFVQKKTRLQSWCANSRIR